MSEVVLRRLPSHMWAVRSASPSLFRPATTNRLCDPGKSARRTVERRERFRARQGWSVVTWVRLRGERRVDVGNKQHYGRQHPWTMDEGRSTTQYEIPIKTSNSKPMLRVSKQLGPVRLHVTENRENAANGRPRRYDNTQHISMHRRGLCGTVTAYQHSASDAIRTMYIHSTQYYAPERPETSTSCPRFVVLGASPGLHCRTHPQALRLPRQRTRLLHAAKNNEHRTGTPCGTFARRGRIASSLKVVVRELDSNNNMRR